MSPRVLFTIGLLSKAPPYLRALESCGLEVNCINADTPVDSLDGYDGLVLGGGTDVDPSLYGELPHAETSKPDKARDIMETSLLTDALRRDIPVFAICRGHQLLNVHQGGTLHQHIENHLQLWHSVDLAPGSLVARSATVDSYDVMSRHHQAIKDVAPALRVTARAADGTIEAVEMDGPRFVLSVQWHPEDGFDKGESDHHLFEAFAASLRL